MFGKRFCPRIRGSYQWILPYRSPEGVWPPHTPSSVSPSAPCIPRLDHRPLGPHGPVLRLLCSGSDDRVSGPQTAARPCGPRNHFYRRQELGRVFKTIFILDYLTDPGPPGAPRLAQRRTTPCLSAPCPLRQTGTDRRDALAAADEPASCLVLILAAIIYWQIREIDTVLRHWDPGEEGIDPALLPHISPIGWDNVILYGEYAWSLAGSVTPTVSRSTVWKTSQFRALLNWWVRASVYFRTDLPATLIRQKS